MIWVWIGLGVTLAAALYLFAIALFVAASRAYDFLELAHNERLQREEQEHRERRERLSVVKRGPDEWFDGKWVG